MKVYVIEQQGWGNSFSFVKVFKTYEAARDWCRKQFEIQDNTDKRSDPIWIDLGIKETAVCSDGTVFQNINKSNRLKKLQKQKKRMQRKFSRKLRLNNHRKSNNSKKLIRKLQLLDRKITNIKTDFRHKMTSEIVKRNPSFVILETLNVHGMMKNKHMSRSIWEQGWYSITTYLQQKCERHQIELIKADRWYASSKTCSNCKSIKQDLTLKDRTFKCPTCGFIIDRDLNAAINLKNYGLTLKNIVA